jgi:hypothetical protein
MANTVIALRSSGVNGNTPSLGVLANGELSLNFADGIIYYKSSSNTLGSIRTTSVSGLTTEVQFNDAGSFGANSNFTFNKTLATLNVKNINVSTNLTASAIETSQYIQFSDGSKQYTANAGSGSSSDTFARTQSNSAFDQANAAFNKANTLTTTTGYVDAFTANGVTTTFTLSTTPVSANTTFVAVQGVLQPKSTYSLTGNILTFDSIPPNTAIVEVTTLITAASDPSFAFDAANSAGLYANSAFLAANNASDSWVRNQANAAFGTANSAGLYANSAFLAANNASDSWVRNQANAAFGTANSAASYANSAFAAANTGSITWYIVSTNTTMVARSGYFVNTTGGIISMTLPTSATLGDTIRINDLAGTFGTNNLTVSRNGHNIQGTAADLIVSVNQSSFGLVYSNSTYGWKLMEL